MTARPGPRPRGRRARPLAPGLSRPGRSGSSARPGSGPPAPGGRIGYDDDRYLGAHSTKEASESPPSATSPISDFLAQTTIGYLGTVSAVSDFWSVSGSSMGRARPPGARARGRRTARPERAPSGGPARRGRPDRFHPSRRPGERREGRKRGAWPGGFRGGSTFSWEFFGSSKFLFTFTPPGRRATASGRRPKRFQS